MIDLDSHKTDYMHVGSHIIRQLIAGSPGKITNNKQNDNIYTKYTNRYFKTLRKTSISHFSNAYINIIRLLKASDVEV